MDEYIDIVNPDGTITGNTCLKSYAHQHGVLHASVHVWLYNKKGQILVQQRSCKKEIYPNLWDVSVAGHIGAGEHHLSAVQREVEEEIGVIYSIDDFVYQGMFTEKHAHANGLIDYELHYVYLLKFNQEIAKLNLQKEEVAQVKFMSIEDLTNQINNRNLFVPHDKEYYQYILRTLNKII